MVTQLLWWVINDSDSSHRPLQVLHTIPDVSCSTSQQPESCHLLMGLPRQRDGQGKAHTRSSGTSIQAGNGLQKDPLSHGRSTELGNSLSRVCAAIPSGPAGIRTLQAEASFEAQHISCCLHAPEIKDSKSKPGSQPKYQKIVVLLMCII